MYEFLSASRMGIKSFFFNKCNICMLSDVFLFAAGLNFP